MSIYEFFHYSLFPGLFIAFTYNKKEPPAFGASLAFWCLLFSFFGLLFCHISNNLSNYNVLTANAPFFYQISGTWSNHEGSILLWCRILSFYGFLLFYRVQSKSHNVSKRGGCRESLLFSFVLNFVHTSNSYLSRYEEKGRLLQERELYTFSVLRTLVDSALFSRRKRSFAGPSPLYAPPSPERQMYFALISSRCYRGSREEKKSHPFSLLHLARDEKERGAWSLDEERVDGVLGIAFFFFSFLSASSDPFVRNFFVRTETLAESNPVSQDPISAIHPPCIYAGNVASAIGFGICLSKMLTRIVALYSPAMRKDANEKTRTLLCYVGCVGSRIRGQLFSPKFKAVGTKDPSLFFFRRKRSLLILLRRRFFAFSSLSKRALVDTVGLRFKVKTLSRFPNRQKELTPLPLSWTAGANTELLDQDRVVLRIWILTCWSFLTVGIMLGSWWAHHELGRGGWWFRDPVENASFMPRTLATARIHSALFPVLYSWTLFLNLVTFLCCVLGTLAIRAGLLASVHSFATDDTRGVLLWKFFLLMTLISTILFSQMKQEESCRRTYKKDMIEARSTLVYLRHLAGAKLRYFF
uniref:Cytochrome c biogenesis FN n=1 Tax=Silene conica TaxID=39875 RepID=G8E8V4_SILCO|nr:cytochrome c biogenesis FN [Silene conica]